MTNLGNSTIAHSTAAEPETQGSPSEPERIAALLDELQAAERAGADALARWAGTCREPILTGVLQVVSARDAAHATLAETRLRELGGSPATPVSRGLAGLCRSLASRDVSDRSKLAVLLARFPAPPYDLFAEPLRTVTDDGETRAMLEAIGEDERVSLTWLRTVHDAAPPAESAAAIAVAVPAVAFLDAYAAAEATAAEVYLAWAAVCASPGLRGGLRVIAAREATHARLVVRRLQQLGVVPRAQIGEPARAAALARFGCRDVTDADKLDALLARYPDDAEAAAPLLVVATAPATDPTTSTLLELIAATEVTTVAWLRQYRAGG